MTSDLLTVPEAAEVLGVKPVTVRAWVLQRRIPYVKLSKCVRLRRADLEQYIADRIVPARKATR
ncbi:MAG TPA: helix-turn-helix domain-containing protein [Candidatus Sulfotelmatobacter sp.]|nr:helix-turn-helix domain-containing protein [Candidatus Sulfotelmatobacter sp.]